MPMLELLVGCEFLSAREAEAALAPHWVGDEDIVEMGAPAPAADMGAAGAGSTPMAMPRVRPQIFMQRCTPHEDL